MPVLLLFTSFFAFISLLIGILCGITVYFIDVNGNITKERNSLPWSVVEYAGVKQKLKLNRIYVLNPYRHPVVMNTIFYTSDSTLVGKPVPAHTIDTVMTEVLILDHSSLCFEEASDSLKAEEYEISQRVVSLVDQHLASGRESSYRALHREFDWAMHLYGFGNCF